MILAYLGSAWLLGIYLASVLQVPTELIWLAVVLPVAVMTLWRRERSIRLANACCLALLLGALRFNASATPQDFDEGHVAHYNDQGWVKIEGVVSDEADVRDTYTNLRVAASEIEVDGQERDARGTALVRAPRYPQYDYGDELEIEGLLEAPPELEVGQETKQVLKRVLG